MMIFFPIGQDTEIRRRPVVTITLLAIMTLVQVYSEITRPGLMKKLHRVEKKYLMQKKSFEAMYARKFAPDIAPYDPLKDANAIIKHSGKNNFSTQNSYDRSVDELDKFTRDQEKNTQIALEKGELVPLDSEEYKNWIKIKTRYTKLKSRFLALSFGFIPSNPRPISWITSIFIHANIFHLLGNAIFFWFVGCNLEDRWGRIVYLLFFFTGGILANYAHFLANPYSSIPAVGASGAISALMGAFLLRFPKMPTRVFWLWFGFTFRFGVITIPAYIGIIMWISMQIILSMLHVGNIAYWAHLGGFAAGAVGAALLMITGLDHKLNRRVQELAENQTMVTEYQDDPELNKSFEAERQGNLRRAAHIVSELLKRKPDDPVFRERMGNILLKQGNIRLGTHHLIKAISHYLNNSGIDYVLYLLETIEANSGIKHVPWNIFLETGRILSSCDRKPDARQFYEKALLYCDDPQKQKEIQMLL